MVGWGCEVSRPSQTFGKQVVGWLGGKRDARLVGIRKWLAGNVGSPTEVGPSARKRVGGWMGNLLVHPWSPVPHTSPVPRSAPDGDDGEAYFLCYATCSAAKSKATEAVPQNNEYALVLVVERELASDCVIVCLLVIASTQCHHPGASGWL